MADNTGFENIQDDDLGDEALDRSIGGKALTCCPIQSLDE